MADPAFREAFADLLRNVLDFQPRLFFVTTLLELQALPRLLLRVATRTSLPGIALFNPFITSVGYIRHLSTYRSDRMLKIHHRDELFLLSLFDTGIFVGN